jgi:hypothetical protein
MGRLLHEDGADSVQVMVMSCMNQNKHSIAWNPKIFLSMSWIIRAQPLNIVSSSGKRNSRGRPWSRNFPEFPKGGRCAIGHSDRVLCRFEGESLPGVPDVLSSVCHLPFPLWINVIFQVPIRLLEGQFVYLAGASFCFFFNFSCV